MSYSDLEYGVKVGKNIMNAWNYPTDISIQNWKSTHGFRSEMNLNVGADAKCGQMNGPSDTNCSSYLAVFLFKHKC